MEVNLLYSASYGTGDGSDAIDTYIDLSADEEDLYMKAIENGEELNDCIDLQPVLDRAWDEIADEEFQNALGMHDCYAMDCAGLTEMEAAEINRLVKERNTHALEFFDLAGFSDAELSDWNADQLKKLPLKKDFIEDFEPVNPFCRGWSLDVEFNEPDSEMLTESISEKLRSLFEKAEGDYSAVNAYVEKMDDSCSCYDVDVYSLASEIADELGLDDYGVEDEE